MKKGMVVVLLAAAAAAAWIVGFAEAGEHETIEQLVTRVGRARWSSADSVQLLVGATQAWDARIRLADSVEHHLFISTFSWHNDDFGKRYRRHLREVARRFRERGATLDLRILGDATSLPAWDPAFSGLEIQGARVRGFNRPTWGLTPVYDGRMHDKLLIADGRRAIVTGRNFADHYFDPMRWWLDLGVMVDGAVVADIQMTFLKSWELTRFVRSVRRYLFPQEVLQDELRLFWQTGRFKRGNSPLERYMSADYFPLAEPSPEAVRVAFLYDNPLIRRRAATTDLLTAVVERAADRVDLMTPFPNFVSQTTDALVAAAARGVRVRLFVNSPETMVRGGARLEAGYPTLIRLLEAGVEVWEWTPEEVIAHAIDEAGCKPERMPAFALHGKMVRVDDELSIVTSSNFNVRSTFYNTEAGLVVLDHEFNDELGRLIEGFQDPEWSEIGCRDPGTTFPSLIRKLDDGAPQRMREALGDRQRRLDAWGVLW
jgi:phosphatidylserine/phosphatidylglycerophosphate/cardiolipin synthase-like enzyme